MIFIHGILGNYEDGDNIVANLTAEGRTAASLKFCGDSCSIKSLVTQVPLAVQTVRNVVANISAFDDGYIIVAHSQGGAVSRAVIEEMDDHEVKRWLASRTAFSRGLTKRTHLPLLATESSRRLCPRRYSTKLTPSTLRKISTASCSTNSRFSTSKNRKHSTRTRSLAWHAGCGWAAGRLPTSSYRR